MSKAADAAQAQFQKGAKEYQAAQEKLNTQYQARQQLIAQQNENLMVKNEFDTLEADGKVYKLIGPVLVPQDLEESKANVAKRLEYITGEVERCDKVTKEYEEALEKKKDELIKLQAAVQKGQQ